MPSKILVGVDFSEHGDEALRQADAWARLHGDELIVCHVTPRPFGVHMLFPQINEREAEEQPDRERELLERLTRHVAERIGREADGFRVIVDSGSAETELVRHAEEEGARLIVVGSHAHARLKHILLGDTAERVLRHAHCSVLVARPPARTGRVLAATDLSKGSHHALATAADHARRAAAPLTVVCSIERTIDRAESLTVGFGAGYGFVHSMAEKARADAEKRVRDQLAELGVTAEIRVSEEDPLPAILRAAEEIGAELVVVGAVGHTTLRRILLGTVAEKVARTAASSVLVVR